MCVLRAASSRQTIGPLFPSRGWRVYEPELDRADERRHDPPARQQVAALRGGDERVGLGAEAVALDEAGGEDERVGNVTPPTAVGRSGSVARPTARADRDERPDPIGAAEQLDHPLVRGLLPTTTEPAAERRPGPSVDAQHGATSRPLPGRAVTRSPSIGHRAADADLADATPDAHPVERRPARAR